VFSESSTCYQAVPSSSLVAEHLARTSLLLALVAAGEGGIVGAQRGALLDGAGLDRDGAARESQRVILRLVEHDCAPHVAVPERLTSLGARRCLQRRLWRRIRDRAGLRRIAVAVLHLATWAQVDRARLRAGLLDGLGHGGGHKRSDRRGEDEFHFYGVGAESELGWRQRDAVGCCLVVCNIRYLED
jgi:hypothetical protein